MEHKNTLHRWYAPIFNVKVQFKFSYHSFSKRLKIVFIEELRGFHVCDIRMWNLNWINPMVSYNISGIKPSGIITSS